MSTRRGLPPLIRFLLAHAAVGYGLSSLALAVILLADPGGLATLLQRASGHPAPLLLLWFFLGLTFGSVQMGAAVMLLGGPDDDPQGGSRAPVTGALRHRFALPAPARPTPHRR